MSPTHARRTFQIPDSALQGVPAGIRQRVIPPLETFLRIDDLNAFYHGLPTEEPYSAFFAHAIASLQVTAKWTDDDLARIPRQGPCILIANHPTGMLDGLLLGKLLATVRTDFVFLGNYVLDQMEQMRPFNIAIDPFGGHTAAQHNVAPIRKALRVLRAGGMLVIFPAGEVASWQWAQRRVTDPAWHPNVAAIIRHAKAPVLPVYIDGANGPLFHLLGFIHPSLRTLRLPEEVLNKRGTTVDLRIAQPIPAKRLAAFSDDARLLDYLRMRTFLLSSQRHPAVAPAQGQCAHPLKGATAVPIAPADSREVLLEEIEALAPEHRLLESGEYQVYVAPAPAIPRLLHEIGRQREIAFRAAGEGTGQASDLDGFDTHYLHLFVWQRQQAELVGAYRLGCVDEIVARHGLKGLYTQTLFHYDTQLLQQLGPALELGRSFVRQEYQRAYYPLMLLWKGIGTFIARHPQYRHLFGPVSISNDYTTMSRLLMVAFLQANHLMPALAQFVQPRRPLRMRCRTETSPAVCARSAADLEELDALVKELECQQRTIPVLLKQYLKLGGRLLGFNVDPAFGYVVDGLILVDMANAPHPLLTRYLGADGMESFLAYHAQQEPTVPTPPTVLRMIR
jgi:putative hemolysin